MVIGGNSGSGGTSASGESDEPVPQAPMPPGRSPASGLRRRM